MEQKVLSDGDSPNMTFLIQGCLSISVQQRPLCSELTYMSGSIEAQRRRNPILFEENGVFVDLWLLPSLPSDD